MALQQAKAIADKPTWDEVLGRLKNDRQRTFTIDIETDSTVAADEQSDQQAVTSFVQAVSQFVVSWGPILQQSPELAPLAFALLKASASRFDMGRRLETVIDEACDALMQKLSQPKPTPTVPKLAAAQAAAQASIAKSQIDGQIAQQESQAKLILEQQESAAAQAREQQSLEGHMAITQVKTHAEIERAAMMAGTKGPI
jgi:hypothetical protein